LSLRALTRVNARQSDQASKTITGQVVTNRWWKLYDRFIFCENWARVHQYADPGRGKSWWGPDPRTSPGLTPLTACK